MSKIPEGFCQCGCGEKVPKALYNRAEKGWIKGQYLRFKHGHNSRIDQAAPRYADFRAAGRAASLEKASYCGVIKKGGYPYIIDKDNPRCQSNIGSPRGGVITEAMLRAEVVVGKHLPKGVVVWHSDGVKAGLHNLVVCQNHGYMSFLCQRRVAYEACGHANYRKCRYCGVYDDPDNMVNTRKYYYHHSMMGGVCVR